MTNDGIKLATSVGGNDGLAKWYSKVPGESLQDAEKRFLYRNESGYNGTLQDIWKERLTDLGYTGTLDDMLNAYWSEDKIIPSELSGLKLWCRYGTGLTEAGSGVSQWDDQSGNSNHLKQGTDTNRPAKQSDGSILFDGVDNFLKADAFTLNQPETIYLLVKQVTWTIGDRIFDGNVADTGGVNKNPTTPRLRVNAGSSFDDAGTLALDTYGVLSVIFNGASSSIQTNNLTAVTGDAGLGNMGGFTLGADGTPNRYSNIQVKEVVVFNTSHDTATRTKVINYLANVGWLSV